jgi:predicted nucleic acid-binding protein
VSISLLWQAIYWYADKNTDFVDAFNAAWLLSRGLDTTHTFDRKHFSRIEGISVQVPGE